MARDPIKGRPWNTVSGEYQTLYDLGRRAIDKESRKEAIARSDEMDYSVRPASHEVNEGTNRKDEQGNSDVNGNAP